MPYITREDGERFVIPSYRDVLAVKQKSALKKEILLLSQSYGEFITLQRKGPNQYEVAFSPDMGHLLGESIWHQFNRPADMIYCEAIPNTTEAILVIVKAGSVYLDGSFPLESIPEELIIFLTQQNNFEIYIYGDVPISETPEEGKFSFEPGSVRVFKHLDEPVFPTLPLIKVYELQRVDAVLRAYGIGVFPLKPALLMGAMLFLVWLIWHYLHSKTAQVPQVITTESPYNAYYTGLSTPAPDKLLGMVVQQIALFNSVPGWQPTQVKLTGPMLTVSMRSQGSPVEDLFAWSKNNQVDVVIQSDGISLTKSLPVFPRPRPNKIYPLNDVIAKIIDDLAIVYPGNHMTMGQFNKKQVYTSVLITITFDQTTAVVLSLIANNLKGLPVTLQSASITIGANGNLSGSIILEALGN